MYYFFDQFEYACPENHRNLFEIAHLVNQTGVFESRPQPAGLPAMRYKLVLASLVLQLHSNYTELDFGKFRMRTTWRVVHTMKQDMPQMQRLSKSI